MNKFIKLIPITGLLLPLSLSATDNQWLTFKMSDNSEVSVAAENLSINYSDEMLHLKSATVDESFAIANIRTMRFTSSSAGINDNIYICHEAADYYTVSGINVGRYATVGEARLELPSGIYVVKSSMKTIKVIF